MTTPRHTGTRRHDRSTPTIGAAIIGAQKCGTTTLAAVLGSHPDVCLAVGKEAHLFDRRDVQRTGPTSAQLSAAFPHHRPGQLCLDATPSYLYLPGCLEALVDHSPDVHLIVLLRSPAARAVSHHRHERHHGTERLPLAAALLRERRRLRSDPDPLAPDSAHRTASYLDRGRYAAQIERARTLGVPLHVALLDEFVARPRQVVADMVEFLGLEPHPIDGVPHLNPGDGRRHRVSRRLAELCLSRERSAAEVALGVPPGALR